MFDHIALRIPDLTAVDPVLEAMLGTLGIAHTHRSGTLAVFGEVLVGEADEQHPVTRGLHIAFVAPTRAAVDAFWRAGVDGGLHDNGAPGLRPHYASGYYGAYLRDGQDNNFEAVHRDGVREDGEVDHITLRVRDLEASTAFYADVGLAAGFRPIEESPKRTLFAAPDNGVLALLPGPPTEHVDLAFPANGDAVPDDGPVLDPDGNTVEVVTRDRG